MKAEVVLPSSGSCAASCLDWGEFHSLGLGRIPLPGKFQVLLQGQGGQAGASSARVGQGGCPPAPGQLCPSPARREGSHIPQGWFLPTAPGWGGQ